MITLKKVANRREPEDRHHQVEKKSGEHCSYRIDRCTLNALAKLQELYKLQGYDYSQGCMVRRAIRSHLEHLSQLTDFDMELVLTDRAKAGVQ